MPILLSGSVPQRARGMGSISREEAPRLFAMASHSTALGNHPVPGTGTAQQLLVAGVPGLLVSPLPAFCLVSLLNSSLGRIWEWRRQGLSAKDFSRGKAAFQHNQALLPTKHQTPRLNVPPTESACTATLSRSPGLVLCFPTPEVMEKEKMASHICN